MLHCASAPLPLPLTGASVLRGGNQTAAFVRFDVNGDDYLAALLNSFVHVLMYSHYLLAAFKVRGHQLQSSLLGSLCCIAPKRHSADSNRLLLRHT